LPARRRKTRGPLRPCQEARTGSEPGRCAAIRTRGGSPSKAAVQAALEGGKPRAARKPDGGQAKSRRFPRLSLFAGRPIEMGRRTERPPAGEASGKNAAEASLRQKKKKKRRNKRALRSSSDMRVQQGGRAGAVVIAWE